MLVNEQPRQNNFQKSYTERKAKHEPSGYSLSLICWFDSTKNKHFVSRGKDCIKHFCRKLKELGTEIINYEKKDMMLLTNEEIKFYESQKQCHICKKGFFGNKKDKYKHKKVRDHCHYTGKFRGAAHSNCNLRYATPKKILIIIHNRSTYDDHFIIEQLPEEFEGQFKCLGVNTEKYITYSVPIKKEAANDDDDDDNDDYRDDDGDEDDDEKKKTEKYRLSFIDSYRFMLERLSNLVDNLSGINDTECKKNTWKFRNDRLRYKCEECRNKSSKSSKYRLKKLFTAN